MDVYEVALSLMDSELRAGNGLAAAKLVALRVTKNQDGVERAAAEIARRFKIIEELEPTRRGIYGGAVGYFSYSGDMDFAIAIRTALIQNGAAYVQAGGGVVADSVPALEYQEAANKAKALLTAIQMAEEGLE